MGISDDKERWRVEFGFGAKPIKVIWGLEESKKT